MSTHIHTHRGIARLWYLLQEINQKRSKILTIKDKKESMRKCLIIII